MLFGDSEQKKKQKEQRSREKEWKGKLTGAGMEKGAAGELAKIITEAQRSGESLQEGYKTSREHLERAQRKIELLLDEMTEEPERDVKKSLDSLIVDLDHVYHICSIREDDPDYGSTVKCLKTASSELGMPDAKISTLMLRSELENRDFKVYYQPKVRLRDGQVASAEALVRWQHPQKGFIYPSDFIPVFERSGDICRLDLYVFEEVCAMLAGRLAQGAPVFPVAVNLSRRHFQTTDFLQRFADIRDQYQIPGGLIELELTESIFFTVGDILNVKEAIRRMHELGFLCSLDDFGAGFSSLGLLKSFMVDSVKLDRSFFLDDSQRAHDVVESIVELARKLGIETVAEGIEAPEQVDFLRSIGCDLVQGYVYARPMPAEELEAWMRARHGGEVTQI